MTDSRAPHRIDRRAFLLGAAGVAVFAATSSAHAADAPQLADVLGAFEHVGGDAERQAVAAAIEDVVRDMSALVRPLARARLIEANPVPASLSLKSDGKRVTLAYAEEAYVAPLDGTPADVVTHAGDEMKLRASWRKGTLHQLFTGDEKSRTNLFRREGDKLAIYVTVQASALPKELVYRLSYARVR
jgi:hypothetical protein